MVAQKGTGQQSMNSGEFAPDLAGRVDIKQYYSAGLQFRNVEPIAQGGFRKLAGTRRIGPVGSGAAPRFWRLKRSRTDSLLVAVLPGQVQIFSAQQRVATVSVPALTPSIAAATSLYLEGDTIGIFHRDLQSLRLVRGASNAIWAVDLWPYEKTPDVDYGGAYPKTDDVWTVFVRWEPDSTAVFAMQLKVNGESTPNISLDQSAAGASDAHWANYAVRVKNELEALPSLGPGVVVTQSGGAGGRTFSISFSGALSGAEYDFSAQVISTTTASALASHSVIGQTRGEPAISGLRGWPGVVGLVQDRIVYAALRSRPSALMFSQTAEYFNINIKAIRDDAAKLEALRTNSAEEILHVKDSKYLLVFTDEAEYFASNRILKRGEPLNFIETTRNGLAAGTWPVEIENRIYYVGQRGSVLFSTAYDDIASAFTARMESLLAPHLVDDIVMTELQRGTDDTDAPRLWQLRRDGLLVGSSVIRDQDITAFFRYEVGAPVRSIGIDSNNRLWIVAERPDGLIYEVMDESSDLFSGIDTTSDDGGHVSALPFADGAEVWCETTNGFTIGPFIVSGGAVSTRWPSQTMRVGLWIAPIFESMPRVLVTGDDKIVRRPGRIHTLKVNVMDTTSIAIGANGVAPKAVSLLRTSDPVDAPMPGKTELVVAAGIPGFKPDTTAVITQTKPGRLRVRDITFEEKL